MNRCRRSHGAALVLVLWLVALLTALIGAFALSARVEHMQQRVQDDAGRSQEIGRAAVAYAVSRMQDDPQRPSWQPDGRLYRWQFDGARVDIRIEDESGKINLNLADITLLQAFLEALGEPKPQALALAGAIIDWRDVDDLSPPGGGAESADYAAAGLPYGPRNRDYETPAELQRVLGISQVLYARMRPMITLYGRTARPDPRWARAPVLTALGLDAALILAQRESAQGRPGEPVAMPALAAGSGTYSIDCRITDAAGRHTAVRAVLRNSQSAALGRAFTVLEWEQGMATQ